MMGFVPRETAPFVLTKEMVHVMGGVESENFKKFVSLCCNAYNILRKNAHQFLILLTMVCKHDNNSLFAERILTPISTDASNGH